MADHTGYFHMAAEGPDRFPPECEGGAVMIESVIDSLQQAWDEPFVRTLLFVLGGGLLAGPVVYECLRRFGNASPDFIRELYQRHLTWVILVPILVVPILVGRIWTVAVYVVISLACYREFARVTGFFRERALSGTVVLSILLIFASVADHWYGFFVALPSLSLTFLVMIALLSDRPEGYIQRIGLAALGGLLFGVCLGHFAYLANDRKYQVLMLVVLVCVESNDIFAFCCGKRFGRHPLCPGTSPGKTIEGAVGAVILTTLLFYGMSASLFDQPPMSGSAARLGLGVLLSLTGQCGDLVMSSIKRDLGTKDFATVLPGHGGFLDRFDSLIFVGPVVFHFVGYFQGIGLDQPVRVFTGGSL